MSPLELVRKTNFYLVCVGEEFKCCQGKSRINETGAKWENEVCRLVDITNTSQEIQFQEFVSTHDLLFRGKAAVNFSDFGVARYV